MTGPVIFRFACIGVPLVLAACNMMMADSVGGRSPEPSNPWENGAAADGGPRPTDHDASRWLETGGQAPSMNEDEAGFTARASLPQPVCLDGRDHGQELSCDEELSCLEERTCCLSLTDDWLDPDFGSCAGGDCAWEIFSRDPRSVSYETSPDGGTVWARLDATSRGESGLHFQDEFQMVGGVTLSFAAALLPAGCTEASCDNSLGVGITSQGVVTVGTGVSPAAAVVLDGESGAVHFLVNGRIEHSVEASVAGLTQPRAYQLRLEADKTVSFWRGDAVTLHAPGAVFTGTPDHISESRLVDPGAVGSPVVFGLFDSEAAGAGRVAAVAVQRALCDVPDGFGPGRLLDLVPPGQESSALGRPAVAAHQGSPERCLVYEKGNFLVAATSQEGSDWDIQGELFAGEQMPFEYGRVAQRAPVLLPASPGTFHLWLELWAETAPGAGRPRVAIAYAGAARCGAWQLAGLGLESDLFRGTLGGPGGGDWKAEVGEPSVVCTNRDRQTGACRSFELYFVGTSAQEARSLGVATSSDGRMWSAVEQLFSFDGGPRLDFERDGWAFPTVVRRGSVLHMWYVGFHGARSSIGYAVATDPRGVPGWQRLGPVFAGEEWEEGRVNGPAVLAVPWCPDSHEGCRAASLQLFYEAGAIGRERLGLASRLVPAL